MTEAVAGHGALIAMELDPTGSPGVFTTIAELNGDITFPGLSRPETEVTPHQDTIDAFVMGILKREALQFSVNWLFDNGTHDFQTGLGYAIVNNELRGFRLRGPGGSTDTDEWIGSGFVQNLSNTNPVREGARTSDCTVRFTGPMIIDGEEIGTPLL